MPEVCGDRELFSPSVSCADSSLVRGSKGQDSGSTQRPGAFLSLSRLRRQLPRQRERKEQDTDLEGTKRAQTGFGKTWRKGVQKAGSGGDAGAQELTSDLLNLQSVGADVVTMHKVEAGFVFILPFF